jgi:hypothetical protein
MVIAFTESLTQDFKGKGKIINNNLPSTARLTHNVRMRDFFYIHNGMFGNNFENLCVSWIAA